MERNVSAIEIFLKYMEPVMTMVITVFEKLQENFESIILGATSSFLRIFFREFLFASVKFFPVNTLAEEILFGKSWKPTPVLI